VAVPVEVLTPDPWHELSYSAEGVDRSADDVDDDQDREAGESVVGRYDGWAAGELHQS
jgi:hypothetical protein